MMFGASMVGTITQLKPEINGISEDRQGHFEYSYIVALNKTLTHLPLVPHIYASVNWVSCGSDNGLSPIQRQAIIETNAGLLSIGPLWTNFSEIVINIQSFSFTKMHLKISSAKWRSFCAGGDELTPDVLRYIGRSPCLFWKMSSVAHLTLIPSWISNYIHHNVLDEITYPFLIFNDATVEV